MNLKENILRIKSIMVLVEKIGVKVDNTPVVNINPTLQKTEPNDIDPNEEMLKDVHPTLKQIFYNVQTEYGSPLKVTYGKRSLVQNKSAGGVDGSSHLDGLALDIKLDSSCKPCIKKLVDLSSKYGALGIGVYKDADTIHIDIKRGTKRENGTRVWSNKGLPIPEWVEPEITKHTGQ